MNLIIMGAPGSGKGSQSARIKEKYHVAHISTGDMLRQAMAEKTELGKKVEEYMAKGSLVPDELIHDLIVERLSKDDIKNGFLFDGYPRTLVQAISFDEIMKELNMKVDHVIYLTLDEEVLKDRITGRRTCQKCGAIFHIKNKPSKVEGVCDECGGELIQRQDDTLEALNKRLIAYHESTEPVIEYYKKTDKVSTINSDQLREEVFADIVKVLGD